MTETQPDTSQRRDLLVDQGVTDYHGARERYPGTEDQTESVRSSQIIAKTGEAVVKRRVKRAKGVIHPAHEQPYFIRYTGPVSDEQRAINRAGIQTVRDSIEAARLPETEEPGIEANVTIMAHLSWMNLDESSITTERYEAFQNLMPAMENRREAIHAAERGAEDAVVQGMVNKVPEPLADIDTLLGVDSLVQQGHTKGDIDKFRLEMKQRVRALGDMTDSHQKREILELLRQQLGVDTK